MTTVYYVVARLAHDADEVLYMYNNLYNMDGQVALYLFHWSIWSGSQLITSAGSFHNIRSQTFIIFDSQSPVSHVQFMLLSCIEGVASRTRASGMLISNNNIQEEVMQTLMTITCTHDRELPVYV